METCIVGEDGTIPERLNSDYCDGVILCSEPTNSGARNKLHQRLQSISTVNTFFNADSETNPFDMVKFDLREVSRLSASFFIEHGVKEIAIFPQYLKSRFKHKELIESFKAECDRADIRWTDFADAVEKGIPMNEYYRKITDEFLGLKTATGMAFITSADMLGVLNELRARGIDITQYEYISAFASEHTLRFFEKIPPFIDLKHEELGVMTAKRLLDRIHSFNRLPRTDIVIVPELRRLD